MTLDDVSYTIEIAYINRSSLDSEGHWTLLEWETGSIVWVPKHLRGYFADGQMEKWRAWAN